MGERQLIVYQLWCVMCCLPGFTAVAKDGRPLVGVELDPMELLRFVADDFGSMNEMWDRAGLSEQSIYHRTKEIMEFFGFPFDVPPPEWRLQPCGRIKEFLRVTRSEHRELPQSSLVLDAERIGDQPTLIRAPLMQFVTHDFWTGKMRLRWCAHWV